MKKITLLAIGFTLAAFAQAQNNFTLSIRAQQVKPTDKAYLCYVNGNRMLIDSVAAKDGVFKFTGSSPYTQHASVYIAPANSAFGTRPINLKAASVYLESGNIQMDIEANHIDAQLSGTPTNDDYQTITNELMPYQKQVDSLEVAFYKARNQRDNATMQRLQADYQKIDAKEKEVQEAFFMSHPDSYISLDWLNTTIDVANDKSKAERLFNHLSERLRKSHLGVRFNAKIQSAPAVSVGDIAPDFTANTPDGKSLSLSSFRGKYVLIDFWASWCGPCRRENPNVVKAHERYKSDKFDILGVSLDNAADRWKAAIEKDGLVWNQISQLQAWQSPIVAQYAIRAIPANFLIDPNGKIIARDLRGETLESKLAELFPNK